MIELRIAALTGLAVLLAAPAQAGSVAGVCPDGSAFIVGRKADAPCVRARFVEDPSLLPPLRPDLLPRPYTWLLDQRARDPNNPYNLLEATKQLHGRDDPNAGQRPEPAGGAQAPLGAGPSASEPAPLSLGLDQQEIRDLVRLVTMRQEIAPAGFTVENIDHQPELLVRIAHSLSFESRVLDALGVSNKRVLLFSARSVQTSEFHPNFFVVRDGMTYRPDPESPQEIGFIVGDPGELEAGYLTLGYMVLPARFDPSGALEIWWNDRSIVAVLQPG